MHLSGALTVLCLACSAAMPARADHIDGHSDNDPVHPVPLPGEDFFSGGAVWMTAIGPRGGSEIINTWWDVTFVSDGATPASELYFNVGLHVLDEFGEDVYVETEVTGADLGFGSGPGTFHGTWETHDLDGIAVESFFFPPYSIVDVIIQATDGGIDGYAYFVDSYIYFDVIPVPAPATLAGMGLGLACVGRRRR